MPTREYAIELGPAEVAAICRAEERIAERDTLSYALCAMPGVVSVDYDRASGFVFFTVEAEHDSPATHEAVAETARRHHRALDHAGAA